MLHTNKEIAVYFFKERLKSCYMQMLMKRKSQFWKAKKPLFSNKLVEVKSQDSAVLKF